MAEILFFHHAHGLTQGLVALADRLRAQGHTVHTPDAYSGLTFARLDEGLAHAQRIGHDAMEEVALRAAREHKHADVVMGFSMGAFPAQLLAQELGRVRGCLLMGGALAPRSLGTDWRHDVALQIHVAQPDEWVEEDDLTALLHHATGAELHRYAGQRHMFVDPSCADYDADSADRFEDRLTDWLERV